MCSFAPPPITNLYINIDNTTFKIQSRNSFCMCVCFLCNIKVGIYQFDDLIQFQVWILTHTQRIPPTQWATFFHVKTFLLCSPTSIKHRFSSHFSSEEKWLKWKFVQTFLTRRSTRDSQMLANQLGNLISPFLD